MHYLAVLFCFLLSGCCHRPLSDSYRDFYSHLSCPHKVCDMCESEYFIIFLVEARHLDYTNNTSFFRTLAKHPSDGSKNGDVGHAWIYLEGNLNNERIVVEGGHSGELGIVQPKYVEGVIEGCEGGDDNPISYLWATQRDGFFQKGSGGHIPTFAVKIDLTEEQFREVLQYIERYPFSRYSVTQDQCSSFLVGIGGVIGICLEHEVTMAIQSEVWLGREKIVLWRDPCYSKITFSTPDILEKSLMELVREGRGEYALSWYLKRHRRSIGERFESSKNNVYQFFDRTGRLIELL